MSDNKKKALDAVKKEDDQLKLFEIAVSVANNVVRLRAAEKIRDPHHLLAVFLRNNNNYELRFKAIEELIDQAMLAYMAKHSYHDVRLKAVEKLTDQELLADVANSDNLYEVCFEAARKIEDFTLAQMTYANLMKRFRNCK